MSALPWLVIVLVSFGGIYSLTGQFQAEAIFEIQDTDLGAVGWGGIPFHAWPILVGIWLTYLVCIAWAAVAWHRSILLNEGPITNAPPFHGRLILGYLGRTLLLGLATVGLGAMFLIVNHWLFPSFLVALNTGDTVFLIALNSFAFISEALLIFVIIRWSLVLPAGAVGSRMTGGESLNATVKVRGQILVVAMIMVAWQWVLNWVQDLLVAVKWAEIIVQTTGEWGYFIFGVSLLTRLYQKVVGRA